MNLAKVIPDNIREYGEYPRLIFEGKEYTNTALWEKAGRLGAALTGLGLCKGDRAVVIMPNCPEVCISYAALLTTGIIVTPLVFLLQAEEIRHVLKDSQASLVVTSEPVLPKILEASQGLVSLKAILVPGRREQAGARDGVSILSMDKLIGDHPPLSDIVDVAGDDISMLLYTSGTTGKPKGVMLSHGNITCQLENLRAHWAERGLKKGETALHVLPLSHSFGMIVMLAGDVMGVRSVLLPWFDPVRVFEAIQAYRVQSMAGVPAMFALLLNHPGAGSYDLGSMERWGSAAAPMPRELMNAFEARFGGKIYEGYGLTEAAPALSLHWPAFPRKQGSVGRPVDFCEVRVMDGDDRPLPPGEPGEIGEIVARGPNIMKGYYQRPEETQEALRGGWLRTGDMGYFDPEGYLYIVERKKDLVIRGGFNVYPREVEEVLCSHPAVAEAAVVGVPDPVMGEEIKAVVVLKHGAPAHEEDIISHARKHVAEYKCPRYVEFRPYLPKNSIGKVLKKELRRIP